ncbi:MAG: NAD(P)H-binding protein [Limosilactobacillus sp.]|jgi:uncharacterized protein YbjT (DUF2867 family)|nr:NAD(P)H-binding protein [Limosilactobacillus sp.]MCH3928645.1 NAD(P)H-binding protein [Limosilactobacillus sp.]
MKKVLIIGATGNVGSATRKQLLQETNTQLTLFSRHADQLTIDPHRERVLNGDANQMADLTAAIEGQDVVFAALSGRVDQFAQNIIQAMDQQDVHRLIFICSMGIYNEVPESISTYNLKNEPILKFYRAAADAIEDSDLDYTIIRPGWFTDGPVNYEITHKGQPFAGHDASISSIADLVKQLIVKDDFGNRDNLGINTPNK